MGWPYRFDAERKFGVEIEVLGSYGTKRRFIANAHDLGHAVEQEDYNHYTRTYWKIVSDASLSSGGFEVVSPPLQGFGGLADLEGICYALTEAGAYIDRSCGLHVHHDASDLTAHDLFKLLLLYAKFEPVIDGLMPPSRRGNLNDNCYSLKRRETKQSLDRLKSMGFRAWMGDHPIGVLVNVFYARYVKVNLRAWTRHGTVEFRQHSGTHEFKKIRAWVVLTQSMINRARIGTEVDIDKPSTWGYFIGQTLGGKSARGAFEQRTYEYLCQRRKKWRKAGYRES